MGDVSTYVVPKATGVEDITKNEDGEKEELCLEDRPSGTRTLKRQAEEQEP